MSKSLSASKIDPVAMHKLFLERYNLFAKDDPDLYSLESRSMMRDIYAEYLRIQKYKEHRFLHEIDFNKRIHDLRQRVTNEAQEWSVKQFKAVAQEMLDKHRDSHQKNLSQCLGRALIKNKNKCGKVASPVERMRIMKEALEDHQAIENITFEDARNKVVENELLPRWVVANTSNVSVSLHQAVMAMVFRE